MYYVRIVAYNVKACRHVQQVAAFAVMFITLSKLPGFLPRYHT